MLLGFDGPVCRVFPAPAGTVVADRLRAYLGAGVPKDVAATSDPLVVLRCAWLVSETAGRVMELELRQLELAAIGTAIETPGTLELVKTLALRGHTVTMISDYSADAVGAYLAKHEIGKYVHEVSARHSVEPTPLMPDPFLVTQAVYLLRATPSRCCLIGGSADVIQAGHAARVPVIGYADCAATRGKLELHRPNAIIDHMTELIA